MKEPSQVLIIDDDSFIRLVVSQALQSAGLDTVEAASGEEGLCLYNEVGADAVLLDVMMPTGMDGFSTCAEFRSKPNGRHLPILMMTGLEDIDSVNRAYEVGATDFITKPINIPLLGHRVRYMLRTSTMTRKLFESEQRLHQMAYFDTLTDLPNRFFFQEYLQRMIAVAERQKLRLGVLFLDLDGFKRINDTLGHHLGDQVLKLAGDRLRSSIRAGDLVSQPGFLPGESSLARLGGDEFTVLLTGIDRNEDVATVAERIRLNMGQSMKLGDHELVTTTSIGIAIFPDDGRSSDELLKNADLAMYYAKRGGGDTYHYFTQEMTEIALRRLSLESNLRKAIERGELELHYQPQYDIDACGYNGLEALLRWQNQEFGTVSPAEFIPLAEDTGLIISIGEWALTQACRQVRIWRESGFAIDRIAVNVSAVQFLHRGFSAMVDRILEDTGLEPGILELELTESALISDEAIVLNVLKVLKGIGVHLAIDDFGTGYSSLSRLKNFPIDRLKIDQAFVRNLEEEPENAAIAVAVIAMAESMGKKVTAEGVETSRQLEFLKHKRCNEVQGFFLSKPLTSTQVEEFLQVRFQEKQS